MLCIVAACHALSVTLSPFYGLSAPVRVRFALRSACSRALERSGFLAVRHRALPPLAFVVFLHPVRQVSWALSEELRPALPRFALMGLAFTLPRFHWLTPSAGLANDREQRNTPMNSKAQTPSKNESPAPVVESDAESKSKAQAAAIAAELNAQGDSISNLFKSSGAIGPLGLEQLAIKLGESTNKQGRPEFGAWLALVMGIATAGKTLGFATQNRLASIANKHVPHINDKGQRVQVAKSKSKGSVGSATCNYRFNAPVAWDIAVGE